MNLIVPMKRENITVDVPLVPILGTKTILVEFSKWIDIFGLIVTLRCGKPTRR